MMMRDFRYIIKKIIIGIGIIIGISMLKSCNVYALEDTSNMTYIGRYTYNDYVYFNYYVDSSNRRLLISRKNQNNTFTEQYVNIPDGYNYLISVDGLSSIKIYDSELYAEWHNSDNRYWYRCRTYQCHAFIINKEPYANYVYTSSTLTYNSSQSYVMSYPNFNTTYTSFDIYNDNKSQKLKSKNIDISLGEPEIVSLHPVLNKTDDNMLVSVSFDIEFSLIDNVNYNYYAWFDGYDKLKIEENNVQLNTQSNTTLFVEITDKNGNSIDTETYTVSSIGLIYNGSYDIQFLTTEYSQSDTENNSDQIYDTINRIDIDMLYIPKWVNYKYQYQYVSENGSLTDNWNLINDNTDNNNHVYTATTNGTMYSRILDSNNNVLYTETYSITRIGQIKTFDKNTDKFYGMFNVIKESLNFGGPISDLIVIPVNVLQAIANASNKVCTPYDLGSLWGYHIVLPCIEPEHYLGSALWTTIDLIFSGCMFFAISKWFTSAYYKFILLDNTPGIKDVPL